ncbi:SPFH domain/Band 7 family protein [Phlyctema vagabunda]|uniref:SPFH domain/Band 7 family protein n=1 Tax=Phlyctema vagabunda TaxID=108571 RepID=A0ABR4PDW6_9HELO
MTKEKLQFLLPVVFTVGPEVHPSGNGGKKVAEAAIREDPEDPLVKYAMLLADKGHGQSQSPSGANHIESLVKGVIEGETRVIVSAMTMEEIFTEREQFKFRVSKNIETELKQFGLKIYNANVKELGDAPGSTYFASQAKKAHEGASNQADVDVAEAQRMGKVGTAQRRGQQERDIAKINAETAVAKTIRDSERAKAESEFATAKTGFDRDVNIAQIEATRRTEERDEELRKAVEVRRAQTELERLRASDVVKATILRESKQQAADAKNYEAQAQSNAEFYSEQKAADAHAYKTQILTDTSFYTEQKNADWNAYKEQKAAEAAAFRVTTAAEANFLAASKEAEAQLVRQEKEAAGLTAMATAYGHLAQAFGGPAGLMQYMMIEKGVYQSLARANADAVRGLNPKMTIWNTGAQAGSGSESSTSSGQGGIDSIRNLYQMLPPLMSTIHDQTGMSLPAWQYGQLDPNHELAERDVNGATPNGKGKGLRNGGH